MEKSYSYLLAENNALEMRLRHLLKSETIRAYDAVDPRTKEYLLDIRKLDETVIAERQPERCPSTEKEAKDCRHFRRGWCDCTNPEITKITKRYGGKTEVVIVCDNLDPA